MNDKDMERIDEILSETYPEQWPTASIKWWEDGGKWIAYFNGRMDEFEKESDACLWLSALFMKLSVKRESPHF